MCILKANFPKGETFTTTTLVVAIHEYQFFISLQKKSTAAQKSSVLMSGEAT